MASRWTISILVSNMICWICYFHPSLARLLNDTEIAKAKRDFELKKAAYDVEVQTKVMIVITRWLI